MARDPVEGRAGAGRPVSAWRAAGPVSGPIANLLDMFAVLLTVVRRLLMWLDPTGRVTSESPPGSLGPSPFTVLACMRHTVFTRRYWSARVSRLRHSRTTAVPTIFKPELVLPSVSVPAGVAVPWPEQPVDLTQLSYEWEGRRRTVEDFMIDRETDGLVFIKDGTLVFEAYANGFEAHTLHHCWSSTKAYVSTLIGNAIHLGLIDDVADPIERYLPAVRGSAWEGTSLHHLLRMESGVAWDEHTSHLFRNSQFAQWQRLTLDYLTDGRLGRTRDAFLLGLPRVEAPGARFNYNSANTQVLAWALEQVHAKPFAQVLAEQLWQPLGAQADAATYTDRVGAAPASMGLYATPRDFARLGQLMLRGGLAPDGRRLLSDAWVAQATEFSELSERQYGYQWWENGPELAGFTASGFTGNVISVAPAAEMVGVRTAHDFSIPPDYSRPSLESPVDMGREEFQALFAAVARELETS